MAQIFHRSTNTLAKVTIFGSVFFLAGLAWVFMTLDRSSYNTGQGVTLAQPVPFSHDHHTEGLGIDCRLLPHTPSSARPTPASHRRRPASTATS